jgi:apolipoprotein N-acyltransferase
MSQQPTTLSLLLRAAVSGALLSLGWPPLPFAVLLFVAWVPLLQGLDTILASRSGRDALRSSWLFAYTAFLVWNGLTTWWVAKATLAGGIFAVLVNSLLMTLPLMVYVAARRRLGATASYITLISAWLTFEYLHMRWELTWPWLTLGNGLAAHPAWVQWYAWTGALGGSLWILLVNVVFYRELRRIASYALGVSRRYQSSAGQRNALALSLALSRPLLLVLVPLMLSLNIYQRRDPDLGRPVNIAVLQTNYDPHTEKFVLGPARILSDMIRLSKPALSDTLDYLIWPETALTNNIDLSILDRHPSVLPLRDMLQPFPRTRLVAGINGYERYASAEQAPAESRIIEFSSGQRTWISSYNTALQVHGSGETQVYHKGILVPGPETYPYFRYLGWLNRIVPGLEDYMGRLVRSPVRTTFTAPRADGDTLGIGPAICYESIFGEYCTGWTKGGSDLLFVITNDGWWGNTAGRKQHMAYARLRAIENRRWVVRSANTGNSCFIDQRGDVVHAAGYDREELLRFTAYANDEVTPYMKQGDLLGRTAGWVCAGLILLTAVSSLSGAGRGTQ